MNRIMRLENMSGMDTMKKIESEKRKKECKAFESVQRR